MDCIKINNLLIDYIDNNLNIALSKRVKEHIDSCESCKADFNQMVILLKDMDSINDKFPSPEMKEKFMAMLEEEKRNQKVVEMDSREKGFVSLISSGWGQVGIGAAVLIIGFLMGFVFRPGSGSNSVQMLENEINLMKQIMMLSKFEGSSASERIQAVSFIQEQSEPDNELVEALIHTLDNDKNMNVRMAAASALSKYYSNPLAKEALVNALNKQKDPLMQITLINLFVELHDKTAVDGMRRIIIDQNSHDVVKSQAQKGIRALI